MGKIKFIIESYNFKSKTFILNDKNEKNMKLIVIKVLFIMIIKVYFVNF